MKKIKQLSYPYFLWSVIFIIVPLFMIFYFAFTLDGSISLENFNRIFEKSTLKMIFTSLKIAFITSAICFVIGYPFAYFMSKLNVKYRTLAMLLIMIPMWMNFLLRSYAWVSILSQNGILDNLLKIFGIEYDSFLFTEAAVILGMVYNFLPFMILPIYTSLEKIDNSLVEAAHDLGANNKKTFWKVIFPMSLPGVFSGITMVFVPVISTFEVSLLLGGGKVNMIGNVIERQFTKTQNWGYGSALATFLMIIILFSLIFDKESVEKGGINE